MIVSPPRKLRSHRVRIDDPSRSASLSQACRVRLSARWCHAIFAATGKTHSTLPIGTHLKAEAFADRFVHVLRPSAADYRQLSLPLNMSHQP